MLVSVHLPKTGGSSFRGVLEEYYVEQLRKDYGDFPINSSRISRNIRAISNCFLNVVKNNNGCIHGHFLPLKYYLYGIRHNAQFITWMRDPVERLASHYYFWKQIYDPELHGDKLLHRKVVEQDWSLERFCLGPEMKNIYCQFLWGFPISRFDFIGVTEYFESDFKFFCQKFLGGDSEIRRDNVNQAKTDLPYITDTSFRQEIEIHHSKDMTLYKKALELRLKRQQ